ncbi:MAG: glycosyltransferase family 39 protein [Bacteroidales bacterium]|nr:glycosyltransferase family 39 protein [Bacteroidales bacterium]
MMSGTDFSGDQIPNKRSLKGILISIILASVVIRGFLAWFLELGNDEVYYWTYALFPDLSHFDHPPMVGFTIQAFTWNLYFDSEFFIRLGSVILGGVNTYMIFLIAAMVKDFRAGIIAALLYNASVYCFVIAGVFILPDTPQLFFWLIGLYILIKILPGKPVSKERAMALFFASIPLGLALLSKYTSIFLWFGAAAYILLYNREWLRKSEFYLSLFLTLLIFSPVIFWNIENKFISFTFQSERVSFFGSGIRPDYFFTELIGQILYNNPINFVIIVIALIAMFRKTFSINREHKRILLLTSIPLIFLFLFFALFRKTLPHWTAPGYISLIVIAAAYLSDKTSKSARARLIPPLVLASLLLLFSTVILGLVEIKLGILPVSQSERTKTLGSNDLTLDMYGWKQFGYKFSELADEDFYSMNMNADAPIISNKWFPAAHLDYYVARSCGLRLIAIGNLNDIHKYAWINRERSEIRMGSDAYFITSSRNFTSPGYLFAYFKNIEDPEIIKIYKQDKHVENFFVYRLRTLYKQPADVLEEYGIPLIPEENIFQEDE